MGLNNAKGYYLAETYEGFPINNFKQGYKWDGCIHFQTLFFFLIQKTLEFCVAGEGEEKSNHYSGETWNR